jgi:hypothetical protein
MSVAEIEAVVEAYANAAADAYRIGFHGIALHGAQGYLIDQFLWSATNFRQDAFGGDLARRARFAPSVVAEIMKEFPFQVNRQTLANVAVTGDVATGDTYTSEAVKDRDGKPAHWQNLHHDEFVKQGGGWLFKSRTLQTLYIGVA